MTYLPNGLPASNPRRFATAGLQAAAGRACDALDRRDWLDLADARTSACDWRTALNLANGVPLADIHPARGTRTAPDSLRSGPVRTVTPDHPTVTE